MDDVKIHSGTRVRLKRVDHAALPPAFLARLVELAEADGRVEAVYLCAIETAERGEQLSLVIALAERRGAAPDEEFLAIVEELRRGLPPGSSFNVYRFGAAPELARWCLESLEPLVLRETRWLERQRRALT